MIRFKRGDILEEKVDALVNTVNCVGVMGRGVALQFKNEWPLNFRAYAAACTRGDVQPGRMFVFETSRSQPRFIVNFPTKRHWRGKSRIEDIESGLRALVAEVRQRGIISIALPPLGAGLGGLDWKEVRPRIEQAFAALPDVDVIVFEPARAEAAGEKRQGRDVPVMTSGRAALVALMERYLAGLLDPSVSLLEVHKLMYFLQEAGEPLRLRVVKGYYGPYVENLRHVLKEIEGYYVSGFGTGGDAPDKLLDLVPGAVEEAKQVLAAATGTRQRVERVGRLVEGFESSYGVELLATVHWVATREEASSEDEAIRSTFAWGSRKRQFSSDQIRIAYRALVDRGWVTRDRDGSSARSESHSLP